MRFGIKGKWLGTAVAAMTVLWVAGAVAGPPPVSFRNGLLSFAVRDAAVEELLKAIGEKAGVPITVGPGVTGRITMRVEDRTLEEVLAAVCENRAIVYEYDREKKAFRIIAVSTAAGITGKGQSLNAPPGPPLPTAPPAGGSSAVTPGRKRPPVPSHTARSGDGTTAGDEPRDPQGRPLYKSREILVQFRPGTDGAAMAALHRSLGGTVIAVGREGRLHRLRVPDGVSEQEAAARYRASPLVELADRHALRYPLRNPNDPEYIPRQWNFHQVALSQAWDINLGRPEVIVAVIDTGVDYTHPDLAGNIWINSGEIPGNGIDDDGNGFVDDVRGWDFADGDNDPRPYAAGQKTDPDSHGTHVAGIVAAVTDNALGVAGVAWRTRIMALKVQSDSGTEMLESDIVAAIDYAIARGARIVNCSFGGDTDDPFEYQAFMRLQDRGVLAVCAAGNNGKNVDTEDPKTYPAYYDLDNIVSVAWSNSADILASGSNYGAVSVDLAAPGDGVYSTCVVGSSSGSYCTKSGTSMAAPHVTGTAALMMAANAAWDYLRVRTALLSNVDKLPHLAGKVASGGRLNAFGAVRAALLPGDVTGDGRVMMDDAVAALQLCADMRPEFPSRMAPAWADIDGDGRIGLAEVIFILQKAADLGR